MASRYTFVLSGPRALPGKSIAISVSLFLLVLAFSAVGCIREEDITLEQRAHQLAGELMCPVCDGQTIDGSNAQIAQDMRLKVRERLDAGDTNAEIRDYFVVRYGEEILAAPKGGGFNLLAWIVPVVIVLGGIGIALTMINNMKHSILLTRRLKTRVEVGLLLKSSVLNRSLCCEGQIPRKLLQKADIGDQMVVIGALDKLEFWNPRDWKKFLDEADPVMEEVAESLEL